jgi:hypothetical protein
MNSSRRLALASDAHDYADVLQKTLLFYRAQRSGDLGQDNNIPWRSAPSFLTDGADVGLDLSRGYFDAGDYVKYGQPAAYTMSVLAWGALEFPLGFERAGAMRELKNAVKWGTDFILEAASQLDEKCTFHAQASAVGARRCSCCCSYRQSNSVLLRVSSYSCTVRLQPFRTPMAFDPGGSWRSRRLPRG